MGSLTSTPKVPETVSVHNSSAAVSTSSVAEVKTSADIQEQASSARKQSLLARSRSRYGTVMTSLQGVLTSKQSDERKTLLGQ